MMRCVVLNGKRMFIFLAAFILLLVIVLATVKIISYKKACEVFVSNDFGMQIVEESFPSETDAPKNRNIRIIENNPMFSYEVENPAEEPTEKPSPTAAPEKESDTPKNEVQSTEQPIRETNQYGKMDVHNETGYSVNLNELAKKKLPFEISNNGVQVLIMHTHTTESYSSSETTKYTSYEKGRTTNDKKNIVAVGNIITDILNQNGIKTIHDTTVHDYPTYKNAYTRAATTIEKNLRANPNIKVVLDIHRDAISSKSGGYKLTAETDGNKASQIMLVVGTDKNGLRHDKWRDNLIFASHIQQKANQVYPGLMRNLNLRSERFNQHMTTGSLIIEMGSNTNTLEEAENAAVAFSKTLVSVLDGNS